LHYFCKNRREVSKYFTYDVCQRMACLDIHSRMDLHSIRITHQTKQVQYVGLQEDHIVLMLLSP